jgi:hypothetical protein
MYKDEMAKTGFLLYSYILPNGVYCVVSCIHTYLKCGLCYGRIFASMDKIDRFLWALKTRHTPYILQKSNFVYIINDSYGRNLFFSAWKWVFVPGRG